MNREGRSLNGGGIRVDLGLLGVDIAHKGGRGDQGREGGGVEAHGEQDKEVHCTREMEKEHRGEKEEKRSPGRLYRRRAGDSPGGLFHASS